MLLGFKKRFEPFILDGSKTHTIRAKLKPSKLGHANRSRRAGAICHCYIGLRQKGAKLLGRWKCTRVEDIRIEVAFGPYKVPAWVAMWIEGQRLTLGEVNQLCWQDGFRSTLVQHAWFEFAEFWGKEHRKSLGDDLTLRFRGDLIHWEYKR